MPCLEWSAEEVEWEQGSGPKRPMSCRTQGWISLRPGKAYFRPLGQFSMIFNGSHAFFSISYQFSMLFNENFIFFLFCYPIRISHFFHFLLIFNVIQWEVCFLSSSHVIQWEFKNWVVLGGGTYGRT